MTVDIYLKSPSFGTKSIFPYKWSCFLHCKSSVKKKRTTLFSPLFFLSSLMMLDKAQSSVWEYDNNIHSALFHHISGNHLLFSMVIFLQWIIKTRQLILFLIIITTKSTSTTRVATFSTSSVVGARLLWWSYTSSISGKDLDLVGWFSWFFINKLLLCSTTRRWEISSRYFLKPLLILLLSSTFEAWVVENIFSIISTSLIVIST